MDLTRRREEPGEDVPVAEVLVVAAEEGGPDVDAFPLGLAVLAQQGRAVVDAPLGDQAVHALGVAVVDCLARALPLLPALQRQALAQDPPLCDSRQ